MKEWSKLKKILVISGVMIAGLIALGSASQPKSNLQTGSKAPTAIQGASTEATTQETVNPVAPAPIDNTPSSTASTLPSDSNLSNSNTYTNVDGNTVHSPAYTSDGSIPAGATAQCVDGTYSFSQHRSGTCSHHGGVSVWY